MIAIAHKYFDENDRLLQDGLWAEVTIAYNEIEDDAYAFYVEDLRPIQLSRFDFNRYCEGRSAFSRDAWIDIILRSVGLEPTVLSHRLKLHFIARLFPLVEPNFNLSYINNKDEEIVVYCPESKTAEATQDPVRKDVHDGEGAKESSQRKTAEKKIAPEPEHKKLPEPEEQPSPDIIIKENAQEPNAQHFTIQYGATGYSYESILSPYLTGAKTIEIEDPYIRANHQVQNFIRFCEAVVKTPTIQKISLCTGYDDQTDLKELSDRLNDVKQSLIELDIQLDININEHLHDREIRIDNGWTIKIGRGLDLYQKPDSWYSVGVYDQSLKKCLETKIDIFKRDAEPGEQ